VLQRGFEVVDDLLRLHVGFRQAVDVFEAVVLQPKNKTG
jgi:hypothetical protein